MIENLRSKSRTTEVSANGHLLEGAFSNTNLNSDPYLVNIFHMLSSKLTLLVTAIKRSKASSELDEKDAKRDQSLRSLFYLVMGLSHHPDPLVHEAADTISRMLNRYGLSIVHGSYATESSLVNSLLKDLAQPELQNTIAALPACAEIIETIQADQAEFETTRVAYEAKKAQEGTLKNATTIKGEVVDIINNKLVLYLKAMATVNEPVYGEFARTVNEVISDNNQAVKRRSKKKEETE